MVYKDLCYGVVGCCMRVHSQLGPGLVEQCYHNSLYYELKKQGYEVGYNYPFQVVYDDRVVGEYFADLVVNGKIIIELKSVQRLANIHKAQLINYLHISGCRLGLLVNFQGQRLEWQRLVI